MKDGPLLDIVVAVADNGVVGRDGAMPWRLPTDLAYFKSLTLGKPLVMGRRTFQSIGRLLPGRHSLVVSRDPDFHPEGAEVYADLDAALDAGRAIARESGVGSCVIAGGGAVYAATIDRADRLFITRVHALPEGDTVFPEVDRRRWRLAASQPMVRGERDGAEATFETWIRAND
jgi:dihydrofolate reductase